MELSAPAARRLLGIPLAQLTDRVVALEDLDAPALTALTDRVGGCQGWEQRLDAVEAALLTTLEATPEPTGTLTGQAWELLSVGVPVAEVAREVGYSRRHLARVLGSELGLTPSQVTLLRRFSRARRLLVARPDLPVARVAAATGYADHSHLVRDCRTVAGRTPSQLRAVYLPA